MSWKIYRDRVWWNLYRGRVWRAFDNAQDGRHVVVHEGIVFNADPTYIFKEKVKKSCLPRREQGEEGGRGEAGGEDEYGPSWPGRKRALVEFDIEELLEDSKNEIHDVAF